MKVKSIMIAALALACAMLFCACANSSADGQYTAPEGAYVLELEGNPTTGYEWIADEDVNGVVNVDIAYVSSDTSGELAGAGGTYYIALTGIKAGTTELILRYMRSWEGVESAEEVNVYAVSVDDSLTVSAELKNSAQAEDGEIPIVEGADTGALTISLPEDISTGYYWILQADTGSGSINYFEEHIDGEDGEPGTVNFNMIGEEAGKMQLQFYYVPKSGDIAKATGSAQYTISIAQDGSLLIVDEQLDLPLFD